MDNEIVITLRGRSWNMGTEMIDATSPSKTNGNGAALARNKSKTIAVTDSMADAAGRIVYWRLTGEVDYDRLVALWEESDLSDLLIPSPTTPARALRLALDAMKERHLLVRSLPGESGYALVREIAEEGSPLSYNVLLHAHLDKDGDVPALMLEDGAHASTERAVCDSLGEKIVAEYERRLDTLDTMAVSSWLASKILPSVKALSLRDRGGVYFIPVTELPAWEQFVEILRQSSAHVMFQIPAMRSDDAVHAILDSLNAEAAEMLERLELELGMAETDEEVEATELGKRAIATREANLAELLEKLGAYEELLDTRLDTLRDRVGRAQAGLTTLALSSDES